MIRPPRPVGLNGRLLTLTIAVLTPIVAGAMLMALIAHDNALRVIEAARAQVVADYVNRASFWLEGSARPLGPAFASATQAEDAPACVERLRAVLGAYHSYRALFVLAADGRSCAAQADSGLAELALAPLAAAERERLQASRDVAGPIRPRFGAIRHHAQALLLVKAGQRLAGDGAGVVIAALDPGEIDAAFDIGPPGRAQIALVSRGEASAPIALRGARDVANWLPRALPESPDYERFAALTRAGEEGIFATSALPDSDLAVVARFAGAAEAEARRNTFLLGAAPLLAALFVAAAYAVALQRGVLDWLSEIRRAARARIDEPTSRVRAPVDERMPRELRALATAFNAMLDDVHAREMELGRTLEQNRHLMRELHHRVKNSLQVIQSYLSLSRREADAGAQGDLCETEARVLVMSAAYRLALTETGMRPVPLRDFAKEIVGNLAATLRHEEQWISLDASLEAQLVVDRAIPFGLAIVEMVIGALGAPGSTRVSVTLTRVERGACELTIAADGASPTAASSRIMQGLALQLQAAAMPLERDMRLRWRFAT